MEQVQKSEKGELKTRWFSILFTLVLSILLTLTSIYAAGEYGIALFILTPIFIGACPTFIYTTKLDITRKTAINMGLATLGIYSGLLIICAIEGLICIVMAFPIALICTWIGSLIAYLICKKSSKSGPKAALFLFLLIPSVSYFEKDTASELYIVITVIEIEASPETVWKNVVEFPKLDEPTEFIFKSGISYPIDATIKGQGVGAIRYCNFNTGSFVEPITEWKTNKRLSFSVEKQPVPMTEMSFWNIDSPHLHDYFVSEKGQFTLVDLGNGKTKLIGTTWYYNEIKPNFYWNLWSEQIIHKIHNRVLEHIKKNSEFTN